MTEKNRRAGAAPARRITMERTYDGSLADVWELWTTKEGIESWWGPDGFAVTVRKLDLRAGGELLYAMTAVAPEMVAFMKKEGMPISQECRIAFTEVVKEKRLAYVHLADFIPGVDPYDVAHLVELYPAPNGVRLVLTFDAMHAEEWTQRAAAGWESELGKLGKVIQSRAASASITPFLWFDNQAEEAAKFYVSVFSGGQLGAISRYGEGAPMPKGTAMTVSFRLGGLEFTALNGGPTYEFTEAISFVIPCKDQQEIDHYWSSLTAGGTEQPCGWLKDRYGLSWQVVPAKLPELLKHPAAVQAMMRMKKLDIAKLEAAGKG